VSALAAEVAAKAKLAQKANRKIAGANSPAASVASGSEPASRELGKLDHSTAADSKSVVAETSAEEAVEGKEVEAGDLKKVDDTALTSAVPATSLPAPVDSGKAIAGEPAANHPAGNIANIAEADPEAVRAVEAVNKIEEEPAKEGEPAITTSTTKAEHRDTKEAEGGGLAEKGGATDAAAEHVATAAGQSKTQDQGAADPKGVTESVAD